MSIDTIRLHNGTVVTIRPIYAQDVPSIEAMHQRLSPDSLYYRYLRPLKPPIEEIQRLYHLDQGQGVAFIVVLGETVVGVATYHIIDKGQLSVTAEPAFLVEDEFQGQGLGRALFERLTRHAQNQGIQVFNFYVHLTNIGMRRLIQQSGFPVEEKINFDIREVQMQLKKDPLGLRQRVKAILGIARRNFKVRTQSNPMPRAFGVQ